MQHLLLSIRACVHMEGVQLVLWTATNCQLLKGQYKRCRLIHLHLKKYDMICTFRLRYLQNSFFRCIPKQA